MVIEAPQSSKSSTHKTVKAVLWPFLEKVFKLTLFPPRSEAVQLVEWRRAVRMQFVGRFRTKRE